MTGPRLLAWLIPQRAHRGCRSGWHGCAGWPAKASCVELTATGLAEVRFAARRGRAAQTVPGRQSRSNMNARPSKGRGCVAAADKFNVFEATTEMAGFWEDIPWPTWQLCG